MRRKVIVERSDRLHHLAPDLTEQFDRLQRRASARGVSVVDLSRVQPLPELDEGFGEELARIGEDPEASAPVPVRGAAALRRGVARWYEAAHGLTLNSETQVVILQDARQALLQLALSLVGPSDRMCTLDPADPLHHTVSVMADCPSTRLPLRAHDGFQPDFAMISPEEGEQLKLLVMGYPHDPTGVTAQPDTYPAAVRIARKYNIIVCHDARQVYAKLDEGRCPSFLEIRGGLGVGVEIQEIPPAIVPSPWHLAAVVGNADVLSCLVTGMRTAVASPGAAIQLAAAHAMYREEQRRRSCRKVLAERRGILVEGLRALGLKVSPPDATPFLWIRVPRGYSSVRFAGLLLRRAGVRTVPGTQFGEAGEGYARLCFAVSQDRIDTAIDRIRHLIKERPLIRRQVSGTSGRKASKR